MLHPIDSGTKRYIENKRPKCDTAFVLRASEALEPLAKDFWRYLRNWFVQGHVALPPVRAVEGLDASQDKAALDGYGDGYGDGYEDGYEDGYGDGKAVSQVVVHPDAS